MSYGAVTSPWWSEVWIVAGGPSARAFDLDRLAGKKVVAVNDAVGLFPMATFLAGNVSIFSADKDWVTRNRCLLALPFAQNYVAIPELPWLHFAVPSVIYLIRSHEAGLSDDLRYLCTGGNSGYAAINLAYLKRATEIHLVGYDMDPNERGNGDKFAEWAPKFRDMLPQLKARGVTVINHNPDSYIDAFEKRC